MARAVPVPVIKVHITSSNWEGRLVDICSVDDGGEADRQKPLEDDDERCPRTHDCCNFIRHSSPTKLLYSYQGMGNLFSPEGPMEYPGHFFGFQ